MRIWAMLLSVQCFVLLWYQVSTKPASRLRAQQIVIEDQSGTPRLTLSTERDGTPTIVFANRQNKNVAILKGYDDAASIVLNGKEQNSGLTLSSAALNLLPAILIQQPQGAKIVLGALTTDTPPADPTQAPNRWGVFVSGVGRFAEKSGIGVQKNDHGGYDGFAYPALKPRPQPR